MQPRSVSLAFLFPHFGQSKACPWFCLGIMSIVVFLLCMVSFVVVWFWVAGILVWQFWQIR